MARGLVAAGMHRRRLGAGGAGVARPPVRRHRTPMRASARSMVRTRCTGSSGAWRRGRESAILGSRWGIGIGAAGVASWRRCRSSRRAIGSTWYTGAVSAAVGVVPFLLSPLSVTRDAPRLSATVAGDTSRRRGPRLRGARRRRGKARRYPPTANSWQQGLVDSRRKHRFQHRRDAVPGSRISPLGVRGSSTEPRAPPSAKSIILTQPTGSISDLRAYERGDLSVATAAGRRGKNLTMFYMGLGSAGFTFD